MATLVNCMCKSFIKFRPILMRHFHISHHALYLLSKILHNLCFSFLLGITAVPREIENNTYAKFGGQMKCVMGNVEVAYSARHHLINEEVTGPEMCPAIVSGIVTGNTKVNHWSVFVPGSSNSPRSLITRPSFPLKSQIESEDLFVFCLPMEDVWCYSWDLFFHFCLSHVHMCT